MKAHYKTANGRITFEVQGETVKDIFRQIAQAQEVFDAEPECGCCQSKDIRLLFRQVEDFTYYELSCGRCHARFQFGQNKQGGGLFPKRKDADGGYLEDGGWAVYRNGTAA